MIKHFLKHFNFLMYLSLALAVSLIAYKDYTIVSDYALSINSNTFDYITYYFVYGNITHFAINAIALLQLAELFKNKEQLFMSLFYLGAIGSGYLAVQINPTLVLVGSSGGVLAVYGYIVMESIFKAPKDTTNYLTHGTIIALLFSSNLFIEYYFNINISHLVHALGLGLGFLFRMLWSRE